MELGKVHGIPLWGFFSMSVRDSYGYTTDKPQKTNTDIVQVI